MSFFNVTKGSAEPPEEVGIYPSLRCGLCGEKVMEPRARVKGGKIICIPCLGASGSMDEMERG
jgi:formylmethanofuran dehydrogenase subunit E